MSVLSMMPPERQACHHPMAEYIGSDGVAEFYRCRGCQHVIVVQGTRSWMLKPAVSA